MSAWRPGSAAFVGGWDPRVACQGHPSLRIVNLIPNDVLCVEDAPVLPNHVYLASAWIRTQDVKGTEGKIGACLCLESSLVRSVSLRGTHDWASVQFYVKVGEEIVHLPLACRLGFWSSTVTGTAWFSDVSLREASLPLDKSLPFYTYGIRNPEIPSSRARVLRVALFGALILVVSRLILVTSGTLPLWPRLRRKTAHQ